MRCILSIVQMMHLFIVLFSKHEKLLFGNEVFIENCAYDTFVCSTAQHSKHTRSVNQTFAIDWNCICEFDDRSVREEKKLVNRIDYSGV